MDSADNAMSCNAQPDSNSSGVTAAAEEQDTAGRGDAGLENAAGTCVPCPTDPADTSCCPEEQLQELKPSPYQHRTSEPPPHLPEQAGPALPGARHSPTRQPRQQETARLIRAALLMPLLPSYPQTSAATSKNQASPPCYRRRWRRSAPRQRLTACASRPARAWRRAASGREGGGRFRR
jgi:hypothetical protein